MRYIYNCNIKEDSDGGFIVKFPDIPEVITGGENWYEALENAEDALVVVLEEFVDQGLCIPYPRYSGGIAIEVTI